MYKINQPFYFFDILNIRHFTIKQIGITKAGDITKI